jgi:glycosidase
MDIMFLANHDTDRAAGFLPMSTGRAQVAANLYLLSPGSPFIYYGEEIGLRGSRGGENTDANRRLAMVWGDGDTVQDPKDSTYTKQTPYSVKDLEGFGNTILQHYRKLIALRKANPEIAKGTYTALSFPDTKAGGFLSEWEGSVVGVFHNTTETTQTLDLSLIPDVAFTQLSSVGMGEASLEGNILTLPGQTSAILR